MGQKPSRLGGRTNKSKLPISWILRGHQTTHTPNPEQPIKFQYKTRSKNSEPNKVKSSNDNASNFHTLNNSTNSCSVNKLKNNEFKCQIAKPQNVPQRTKSEPSLVPEKTRHRHRRKSTRDSAKYGKNEKIRQQFGYEIQDVDAFLTKVKQFFARKSAKSS